jgi:leader peptidase (prepilin peptidase)/N-methyltransferase
MLYPVWIDWSFVILLGLLLGSFTSCIVYRLPRDLPLWHRIGDKTDTRYSFCPHCGHRLGFWDLFPVLSWTFLRGKCRYCKAPISPLDPGIELTTVLFCVVNFGLWQEWNPQVIVLMAVAPVAVGLFYIDALWRLLPDKLNIVLAVLGLAWIAVSPLTLINGVAAGVILGGCFWFLRWIFWRLRNIEAMGLGDVKFVAAAGLWLGTPPMSLFLFLCGFVGILYALVYRVVTKEKLFPFGPALIIAWWICIILANTPLNNFLTPLLLP